MSDSHTQRDGGSSAASARDASAHASSTVADGASARTYVSSASADTIATILGASRRPLLVSHAKPDGDAVGSMLALHRALEARGAAPTILLMGPVEPSLIGAADGTPMRSLERDGLPSGDDEPDLIVVVDTGAWAQLDPIAPWLRERAAHVIGIDHHARGDDVATRRIVDASCASTTQVIVGVLDAMKAPLTPRVADALFMGLATDTGWFRFSSADHRVYALAARLLDAGADKDRLYAVLEQALRPSQLALQARALASLTLLCDGRAALMRLRQNDFAETGGAPEDTGGLVNDPLALGTVRVSVLLTEHERGVTRLSFRSKPAMTLADGTELPAVDVNEIASRVGGGGHVHAAGARLDMPIDEAAEQVVTLLAHAVN